MPIATAVWFYSEQSTFLDMIIDLYCEVLGVSFFLWGRMRFVGKTTTTRESVQYSGPLKSIFALYLGFQLLQGWTITSPPQSRGGVTVSWLLGHAVWRICVHQPVSPPSFALFWNHRRELQGQTAQLRDGGAGQALRLLLLQDGVLRLVHAQRSATCQETLTGQLQAGSPPGVQEVQDWAPVARSQPLTTLHPTMDNPN